MAGPWDDYKAAPAAAAGPWDDFRKPTATAAPAEPAPPPESPRSGRNLLGAATEPLAALTTGAVAGPLSGLAGMAGTMLPGPPGQGADWTHRVGNAMTYQPRSQGGKTALGAIAYPFEKIAQGADAAGGRVSDVAGPAAGAGTNALLQLIPQLLLGAGGRKVAPVKGEMRASPEVQMLAQKGVTMTPGEVLGGKWGRAEEAMQSAPIAGEFIRSARGKGVEQFGSAAIDDALRPIGQNLPKGMTGQEALAYARETLGSAYENLLPKMRGDLDNAPPANALPAPGQLGAPPPTTFRMELENIRQMGNNLPELQRAQLNRILDNEIIGRFTPQGKAGGDVIKNIESKLTGLQKRMRISEDYDVRTLGDAVEAAQQSMRKMIEDVNPGYGKELKAINEGYAKFKIAQKAGASVGSKEGVFTPSQYRSAVKAKDSSKDKRAFSEGDANQQPLAEAGKKVLSDRVPDSGTPGRLLLLDLLLGGGGHAALGPGGIAAGLALPALYSQPAMRAMQPLLMRPPNAGHAVARGMPLGAMQQQQIQQPPQ